MHDQKQLHEIALDYPWYMFTGEEIAELCNVSQNVIWRVKALSDSPFFLNKCRPEWFLEWMRIHPDFQLTKAFSPEPVASSESRIDTAVVERSVGMQSKRIKAPKPISRRRSVLKR
jgi:hypothetical protein